MKSNPPLPTPFGRALRNVGWLLTGKGLGAVLSLVYLGLATRSLGVEQFGQFALIISLGQATAALVGFQSWQIVVRYGVEPLKAGDGDAVGRLVRFCALLDLGAALVGCAAVAIGIVLMAPRFGWSPALARDATLFCFILLLSVRSTAIGFLRLNNRFAACGIADAVNPIVRFLGAIAVVVTGPSIRGFLIAWAVSEMLTALTYWGYATRIGPGVPGGWRGVTRAPVEHPGFWNFAVITNIGRTVNATGKQIVVVLVGLIVGPVAAGAYRLAFQLSEALARLSDMFSHSIFPEFTRAHFGESRDALQRLFRQSTLLTVGVGAAICVVVPIIGDPMLRLVGGDAYAGAYPLLLLLSIAAALDLMGVGFEPVLLGTGRQGTAFRIRLASVAVLLAGVAILMPTWGAIGAATATLIASAVTLAMFGRSAYRATRSAG